MNKIDANKFITDELLTRWEACKPSESFIYDWVRWLYPYDWKTAQEAVHKLVSEGYKKPSGKRFKEIASSLKPSRSNTDTYRREATVFIQCIEHDNPCKRCWYVPIYVAGQYANDPDYILKAAENMKERHHQVYGGEWRVIRDTNYTEMNRQLHQAKFEDIAKGE